MIFAGVSKKLRAKDIVPNCNPNDGGRSLLFFEHLTATNRELFDRARANANNLGYERCFTNDGKTIFQQKKNSKKFVITYDILQSMIEKSGRPDKYVQQNQRQPAQLAMPPIFSPIMPNNNGYQLSPISPSTSPQRD